MVCIALEYQCTVVFAEIETPGQVFSFFFIGLFIAPPETDIFFLEPEVLESDPWTWEGGCSVVLILSPKS